VAGRFDASDPRRQCIADFLRRNGRIAADTFMVGNTLDDLALAEQAGLPLFLWADEYFAPAA
jgi:phosphoglycolate phosphatase-like HAD superfamily hydrolase